MAMTPSRSPPKFFFQPPETTAVRDEGEEDEDSLDLMLDTLCNAFGGIILITLLIALMSQEAGQAIEQPQNFSNQAMVLKIKIQNLQDDLEDAEIINEKLDKEKDESVDDKLSDKVDLLDKRRAQREKVKLEIKLAKQAIEEIPKDTSDLAEQLNTSKEAKDKDLAKLKDRLESTQEQIDEAKEDMDGMDAEISKQKRQHTEKVRLPKEKGKSSKTGLWVFVCFGKIYPLYVHLNGSYSKSLNKADFIITEKRTSSGLNVFFKPRPLRGFSLPRDRTDFLRYLGNIAKRTEYLSFAVFQDDRSFESFNLAKKIALAQGIGYTWRPWDEENIILTTSGGHAPRPEL